MFELFAVLNYVLTNMAPPLMRRARNKKRLKKSTLEEYIPVE